MTSCCVYFGMVFGFNVGPGGGTGFTAETKDIVRIDSIRIIENANVIAFLVLFKDIPRFILCIFLSIIINNLPGIFITTFLEL